MKAYYERQIAHHLKEMELAQEAGNTKAVTDHNREYLNYKGELERREKENKK